MDAVFGVDLLNEHLARAARNSGRPLFTPFSPAEGFAMSRDLADSHGVTELRVDGGACVNNLLMQFQADLLGVSVVRPVVTETTALGAAYLAGLGVGYWKNLAEIATQWQAERTFKPSMKSAKRQSLTRGWSRALARAQGA